MRTPRRVRVQVARTRPRRKRRSPATPRVRRAGPATIAALLVALGLTGLSTVAHAATFTVTKTADGNDGSCNADCSLRDAVVAANATPGLDTITVPAGTFTLTISGAGEDAAATGDLDVTDHLTIQGAGANATVISGADADRVFQIAQDVRVTINGVTAANGFVDGPGGGILNSGSLTLTRSALEENVARGDGGGLLNSPTGTASISQSTLYANEGANGGGVANEGAMTITNSTINDNLTTDGVTGGGGILNSSRRNLEVVNSTVAENEADGNADVRGRGDALAVAPAPGQSGTVAVRNSILASPHDGLGTDCHGVSASSPISGGYNIASDPSCFLTATGDQVLDPMLGNIAANGGTTKTMLPLGSSPARDQIPSGTNGCGTTVTVDQRGTTRPQGGACDVGAVEVASQSTGCITPPANMRAWWPFDEVVGPTAADRAGTFLNNGTHVGGPATITGMVARALRFNTGKFVSAPHHSELLFGKGSLSVDAWVRTRAKNETVLPIVDKRVQSANGKPVGYTMFLYQGRLAFQLADGGSSGGFTNYIPPVSNTKSFVANGKWRHVTATIRRPSSPLLTLYVDGAQVASFGGTIVRSGSLDENGPLWIGRRRPVPGASYANAYFQGDIDEVELFARALAASEVKALFKAGPSGKCKPPAALTNLDPAGSTDTAVAAGDKRCPNQPYFRYVGGKPDNFATPQDTAYPSLNFSGSPVLNPNPRNDYDVATSDRWFGESFNLEERRRVCHAVLRVTVKPNNPIATNDSLTIGQVSGNTFAPLAGQVINPGNAPGTAAVTGVWSFNAAGLAALSTITGTASPNNSVLDIYLHDDTTIDHVVLWVWYHP